MDKKDVGTALVTGGHGFLGSHLVDLLLDRGWSVSCLLRPDRDESVFQSRPVRVLRDDLGLAHSYSLTWPRPTSPCWHSAGPR